MSTRLRTVEVVVGGPIFTIPSSNPRALSTSVEDDGLGRMVLACKGALKAEVTRLRQGPGDEHKRPRCAPRKVLMLLSL